MDKSNIIDDNNLVDSEYFGRKDVNRCFSQESLKKKNLKETIILYANNIEYGRMKFLISKSF